MWNTYKSLRVYIKGNDEIHSPQRNWAMKGW